MAANLIDDRPRKASSMRRQAKRIPAANRSHRLQRKSQRMRPIGTNLGASIQPKRRLLSRSLIRAIKLKRFRQIHSHLEAKRSALGVTIRTTRWHQRTPTPHQIKEGKSSKFNHRISMPSKPVLRVPVRKQQRLLRSQQHQILSKHKAPQS